MLVFFYHALLRLESRVVLKHICVQLHLVRGFNNFLRLPRWSRCNSKVGWTKNYVDQEFEQKDVLERPTNKAPSQDLNV